MIIKKRILLFSILLLNLIIGAAFNRVNTLINTPTARFNDAGSFQLGFSYAPYEFNDSNYLDDDIYLNFYLDDFFIIGVTRLYSHIAVLNVQLLLAKDIPFKGLNVAIGAENLTYEDKLSPIGSFLEEKYSNNKTYYMVCSYRIKSWQFSLGFGSGRFIDQYYKYDFPDNNLFSSICWFFLDNTVDTGYVCLEHDAKNLNIGVIFPIGKKLNLKIAATQLPWKGDYNEFYGDDIPYQKFSLALEFDSNFSDFFQKKSDAILDKSTEEKPYDIESTLYNGFYNKVESYQPDLFKNKKISSLSKNTKDIEKLEYDIINHYYKSFKYYYEKKYFLAIEELNKAIKINDQIPALYIRLGSIYWMLELREEAIAAWRRAYVLDRENQKFNDFLEDINIKFADN